VNNRSPHSDAAGSPVRLHARRVALVATTFALVLYIMACLVADLLAVDHLSGSIDSRLIVRLGILTKEIPNGSHSEIPTATHLPIGDGDGDLDDAPVLAWFVPQGAKSAQRLDANSPVLPASYFRVSQPTNAHFAGRGFRLDGAAVSTGRFLVGTSTQGVSSVRATLLLIEGLLAPIILLSLFLAATVIGRRAAAPIERARRRQLEFTADASHELRTPLSVIEAEVGLALSSYRSADAYRMALERISGESKRLRSIVNDLLWLARLDSLPANPPHEAVDMASLARSCSERFDAIASQKSLTISVEDPSGHPPLVLAPAEWLDRLVSVLLDNACRYANVGGQVKVGVVSSNDRVTLIVDDDGPGIAEEEREHIAQRFRRASAVPGGAGLGLAIADAVVRATNGEWKVATAPLGGVRIQASWPRVREDDGYGELADVQHSEPRAPTPVIGA
jgi:signal transduction histidine kinase